MKESELTWVAVIGTLAGTVIGMVGTIVGQQIAAKSAERRERLQRHAALRVERKVAIDLFFEAEQEAERVAADPSQLPNSERGLVAQKLWFRHKQLTLICSDDLRAAADDLSRTCLGPACGMVPQRGRRYMNSPRKSHALSGA
ncbi:hypothetical protein [Micromonospora sp. NPDC048947]|uniref:hypothetical protein n=1 Tax=Micromonospora sp. NPDC048947 TaxID=3154826 RepID=UPI0033C0F5D8